MSTWTFLGNHAHILVLLCRESDLRLRDIAVRVDITERAVSRIIHELVDDGYVVVTKKGRRNYYEANLNARLRHPLEGGVTIGEFIGPFVRVPLPNLQSES